MVLADGRREMRGSAGGLTTERKGTLLPRRGAVTGGACPALVQHYWRRRSACADSNGAAATCSELDQIPAQCEAAGQEVKKVLVRSLGGVGS